MGLVGIVLTLISGARYRNYPTIAGAVVFMIGGSFGFTGKIGPINRVDIFHVCGAVAWYLLSSGLSKLSR